MTKLFPGKTGGRQCVPSQGVPGPCSTSQWIKYDCAATLSQCRIIMHRARQVRQCALSAALWRGTTVPPSFSGVSGPTAGEAQPHQTLGFRPGPMPGKVFERLLSGGLGRTGRGVMNFNVCCIALHVGDKLRGQCEQTIGTQSFRLLLFWRLQTGLPDSGLGMLLGLVVG